MVCLSIDIGNKLMEVASVTDKMIKFVSTNLCVVILMLVVLISHYSLVGLISFFVGSILLFLGTLLDDKKANFGVTSKLSYIVFIATLTLFGMWLPFVLKNKIHFEPMGKANVWGIIISLGLAFIFFIMSGSSKFNHYLVRRCLKYSGQILFLLGFYYFWDLPHVTFRYTVITVIVFLLTDLFSTKYIKYNTNEFKDSNNDKAFWMAFLINLCFVALNLFYRQYFMKFATKEAITQRLEGITSGFYVPLFIILMVVLTVIYVVLYERAKDFNYSMIADAFFTLSLGGFVLLFRIYESNRSIESFILLSVSTLLYLVFLYSIPSTNSGSKKNPVYYLIRLDGDAHIFISLIITVLSIPGIIFAKKGYIIPVAFLIASAIIVSLVFIKCQGSWVKKSIRWQITLICILAFVISISVVNSTLNHSLLLLIFLCCVSSLGIWTIGIREDIVKYNYQEIVQCITCVASCGIGLIAVGI